MKKLYIVLLLLAFGSVASFAQDQKFQFGIKAGLNFADFKIKDDPTGQLKADNVVSWQAGIMTRFNLPILGWAVQPELLYTSKESKFGDNTSTKRNKIGYFEIPVNLYRSFNLFGIRPSLMVGPYFGYAVNFSGSSFNKDNINRFDWGLGAGVGVDVWRLHFAARYAWGLKDISKVGDVDLKNNVFTLSVGYFF